MARSKRSNSRTYRYIVTGFSGRHISMVICRLLCVLSALAFAHIHTQPFVIVNRTKPEVCAGICLPPHQTQTWHTCVMSLLYAAPSFPCQHTHVHTFKCICINALPVRRVCHAMHDAVCGPKHMIHPRRHSAACGPGSCLMAYSSGGTNRRAPAPMYAQCRCVCVYV